METLQPAEVMSYLQMLKPEVAVAVMSGKHLSLLRSSSFLRVNVPTKIIYPPTMKVREQIKSPRW